MDGYLLRVKARLMRVSRLCRGNIMEKLYSERERNIQEHGNNYTPPWTDVPETLEMKLIVIDDISVKRHMQY